MVTEKRGIDYEEGFARISRRVRDLLARWMGYLPV